MNYMYELASVALMSKGNKKFTIQDGHEMTITSAGDGKTMSINIDDGMSYTTKGVRNFIKKIEAILKDRCVAGWGETPEGHDTLGHVLSMYQNVEGVLGSSVHTAAGSGNYQ